MVRKRFRYTEQVTEYPGETTAVGTHRTSRQAGGFSLVEMAVVTLLIGIFLTMGLAAFRASQESQAVSQTINKQNAIKDALIGYLRRNGRLPCADVDITAPDGIENRTGGTTAAPDPTTPCATAPSNARFGIVPYTTLGLARDAAVDGWGNFFSYQISNSVSSDAFNPGYSIGANYNSPVPAYYRDWTLTTNLRPGNIGELTINDRDAAGNIITVSTNVVAVIVSHGPNGFGAYTISGTRNSPPGGADELENTDGGANTTYFRRTATTDDAAIGGAFDDRVMFLTPDDLFGPLFKDGSLKPPAAQLSDTFQKITNAIGRLATTNASSYGGSFGGHCNDTSATPKCRIIPSADFYYGDGNYLNSPVPDGGVPWSNLGLVMGDTWDPWGRPIRYAINTTSLTSNGIDSVVPAGSLTAYTLTSFGPDRISGTSDDVSMTVSVKTLRDNLGVLP